jgi:hypothetical protein
MVLEDGPKFAHKRRALAAGPPLVESLFRSDFIGSGLSFLF